MQVPIAPEMLPVYLQPGSSHMLFPELASEAAGALGVTSRPFWAMPKSGCLTDS